MRLLAAPDKFKGTATAAEIADAAAGAARTAGWTATTLPLADGGDGTLAAFGGANRTTLVTGPLGEPIEARWRFDRTASVVEMAEASGLVAAGGAEGNDAMAATTTGTGELLVAAMEAGAKRIIVGVGGSATTDGGLGALRAMEPLARFRRIDIDVACDVRLPFVDAARVFGPQKGASGAEIELLERRLQRLAQIYEEDHGVDVTALPGSGAAGGLAGGLAAMGATLASGFELVADEVDLAGAVEAADLVVTGEGYLDEQSFDGKVVGGVVELAAEFGVPVLVVVGGADPVDVPDRVHVVSLADTFGADRAFAEPAASVAEAVATHLGGLEVAR